MRRTRSASVRVSTMAQGAVQEEGQGLRSMADPGSHSIRDDHLGSSVRSSTHGDARVRVCARAVASGQPPEATGGASHQEGAPVRHMPAGRAAQKAPASQQAATGRDEQGHKPLAFDSDCFLREPRVRTVRWDPGRRRPAHQPTENAVEPPTDPPEDVHAATSNTDRAEASRRQSTANIHHALRRSRGLTPMTTASSNPGSGSSFGHPPRGPARRPPGPARHSERPGARQVCLGPPADPGGSLRLLVHEGLPLPGRSPPGSCWRQGAEFGVGGEPGRRRHGDGSRPRQAGSAQQAVAWGLAKPTPRRDRIDASPPSPQLTAEDQLPPQ